MMIHIHYHGFYIHLCSEANLKNADWLTSQLLADFAEFEPAEAPPNLEINILKSVEEPALRLRIFSSKLVHRYLVANGIFYKGRGNLKAHLKIESSGLKTFCISGDNSQHLYEVLYAFILSSIGEHLEARGMHRVHGLGIANSLCALIVPLPSGRGKSTMAHWLLENTDLKFLGEETVFTNGREVLAFPIRRAICEKDFEASGAQFERLFNREKFEKKYLLGWRPFRIVERQAQFKIVLFENTFTWLSFAWSFFWGLGNAQMAEFFIRADNIFILLKIAWGRLKCLDRFRGKFIFLKHWQSSPQKNWDSLVRIFHQI